MEKEPKIIHSEDLKTTKLFQGAEVSFLHSETMTIAEWYFEPNTPLPEHSHPHEQIVNVISGELELTIEKKKYNLKPGSKVIIPGDKVHSAKAITECHVIDVFHPVREDYK